jgi:hypothetical protein
MLDLAAILIANDARRARKTAATPGEWGWDLICEADSEGNPPMACLLAGCDFPGGDHEGTGHTLTDCGFPVLRCEWHGGDGVSSPWPNEHDAAFIAAARNDPVEDVIDALCEEIATLRRAVRDVRLAVEGVPPP